MSFLGGCMIIPSLWVMMIVWCGWRQRMITFQLSLFTPRQVGERSLSLMVQFGTPAARASFFFAWKASWAKILTQDRLKKRGWRMPNRCCLSKAKEEMGYLILLHCLKACML